MRKKYLYIGVGVLAATAVIAFIGANKVREQSGGNPIEELRARSSVVEQRVMRPRPTVAAPPAARQPQEPPQDSDVFTDTVAAYERLVEEMKETEDDGQWEEALRLIHRGNWGRWTDEERALVAAYLEAHGELILGLRQLLEGGEPLFDIDYSQGFKMELPSYLDIRKVSWLLLADAALAAVGDDYGAVLGNYRAFSGMMDILAEQPVLISQMMRASLLDMLYGHVGQTLRGEDMPPEVFRQLTGLAAAANHRDGLGDALAFEGLFGLEVFSKIRMGDIEGAGIPAQGVDRFLIGLYGSAIARPFLSMDEAAYAGLMNTMSDALALPYYAARPLLEQLQADLSSLPRTRFLTNYAMPNFTSAADAQARAEAQMGLMQVGLAVEHYYGQHGAYPETLEQVAPVLGGAMPLDPYTGRPFVYETRRTGFTLYSEREAGNIIWRDTGK